MMRHVILALAAAGILGSLPEAALAQRTGIGICRPVSERAAIGDVGCWIIHHGHVGRLADAQVFWHLDVYPTRDAAQAARGPRGSVIEAFGKIWLLTIGEKGWRPSGGDRVNEIGPLSINPGRDYVAQYMEATFNPGMTAPSHRHSGPEAWHTLAGETCLETPDGKFVGRAGGPPVIVPEGPPMHLTATGTEQRRALVLILHDAEKDATAPRPDFVPKGLCKE
jgi:quercetin dioxygenase-like cupin family protein